MERKGEWRPQWRRDEQNPDARRRAQPSSVQGPQVDNFASLAPADSLLDPNTRQQLLQIQARQIMQAQVASTVQHPYGLPSLMHPAATFSGQLARVSQSNNIMTTSRASWSSDLPANSLLANFSLQQLQILLSQQRVTGINQLQQHAYGARLSSYLGIQENTHLPPAGTARSSSYVTGSNVVPVTGFSHFPRHHREVFSANAPVAGDEITQPYLPPMIDCSLQNASRQEPWRAAATALEQPTDKPCKRIHDNEARPAAMASQDAHPRQADDRFSCPPGRVEVEVKTRRRYSHECFPEKLHRLIREATDDGNDHIIAWLPDGNGFEIHSLEAFERFIIPAYFRHQKLASFRRQLSMYGFRRDSSKQDARRYVHLWFHRDHPERCKNVKRLSDYQLVLMKKK